MDVVSMRTEELSPADLVELRAVLDDAFVDDPLTEEDWQHCLGGVHLLAREGGELLAHAVVVVRSFLLDGRPMPVGYVEGVGVRRARVRQGIGGLVMASVEAMGAGDLPALALAASDEGLPFYRARGWRPWPGQTYVATQAGLRRTPEEDGSVMVWPHGPFGDVGPDSALACEERPGEDW